MSRRLPYSYKKVHATLRRLYGPASDHVCPCGEPAVEWAYQFTGEELRSPDDSRPHSVNPDDYEAMCRKCHQALDWERDPVMAERVREGSKSNSGGKVFSERFHTDPEFAEKRRALLRQNSIAIAERRKVDPEFDAHVKRGGNGRTERMKDPEFAAQVTATLRANAAVRVQCNECGLVSNRGGMGNHRRFSGHPDWVYVNEEEEQ